MNIKCEECGLEFSTCQHFDEEGRRVLSGLNERIHVLESCFSSLKSLVLELNQKKPRSVFVKPTLEELQVYCKEIGFDLDCQGFIDFYESKGWLVGKAPMKSWKAAVRTWKRTSIPAGNRPDKKTKLFPIAGKNCCKCKMPAVYKDSGGGYDSFYCNIHMPEKIKEKYC